MEDFNNTFYYGPTVIKYENEIWVESSNKEPIKFHKEEEGLFDFKARIHIYSKKTGKTKFNDTKTI